MHKLLQGRRIWLSMIGICSSRAKLELHESGTYAEFTQPGADLFA